MNEVLYNVNTKEGEPEVDPIQNQAQSYYSQFGTQSEIDYD
jgi:hypothetical protein